MRPHPILWITAAVLLLVVSGLWIKKPASASVTSTMTIIMRVPTHAASFPSPVTSPALEAALDASTTAADQSALTDPGTPLKERLKRAFALAGQHPQRALRVLQSLLAVRGTSRISSALAEGLGASRDPAIVAAINTLVSQPDETVARGAVRGIGGRESPEAAALLGTFLLNANLSDGSRTEAALVLGRMQTPAAAGLLFRASYEAVDLDDYEPVFHAVAEAMAGQPTDKALTFFTRLMAHPDMDTPQRTALLNDLGGGDGRLAPLLLKYAHDSELEIREAAIGSLGAQSDLGQNRSELQTLLRIETDPALRLKLQTLLAGLDSQER